MNNSILSQNKKKRLNQPLWMLICFSMFCFWQMGIIYFVGPSLTIDGKTPLPMDTDNVTTLIAVCYVLSILWMIFIPRTVVWTQRIVTGLALLSAVGLFLPLSHDVLRLLIYVQVFCCCLMIGFETFIMVNYFSENSSINHLTLAYSVSLLMIALLQNSFLPITFPVFRIALIAALVLLMTFFLLMPAGKSVQPRYIKKSDRFTSPKRLLVGAYVLVFICSLMAVSGPAISAEVTHGVFITYIVDAAGSFILYILYKKANVHPFKLVPILVGLGCIGFLLMFASTQIPFLSYISCAFIGIAMISCQMLPLYGAVIMHSYPSRFISPIIISLALGAVLVQGSMVEVFRDAPTMLYLIYAVIMVILVFIYMQIEPFFLFTLRRRIVDEPASSEVVSEKEQISDSKEDTTVTKTEKIATETPDDPLNVLSKKEKEVAELICLGYTNGDIAKMLYISEHTVKDHTKKIYPKMGVHSRLELATLVNRERSKIKN